MSKSLFEMLGIADQERIHSQTIAWLLSPNYSPLNSQQICELIKILFEIDIPKVFENKIIVITELNNLDLVIIIPQTAFIVVENKIKSRQRNDQLNDYDEKIIEILNNLNLVKVNFDQKNVKKYFLVFSDEASKNPSWISINYENLLSKLNKIKNENQYFIDYKAFLNDLISFKNQFCKNHTEYKSIFDCSGMRSADRLKERLSMVNDKNKNQSDLELFAFHNKLERLYIECLYQHIFHGFKWLVEIGETHGTVLMQFHFFEIKFNGIEHWFRVGLQLQGNAIKLNIAAVDYKNSESKWLPNQILDKSADIHKLFLCKKLKQNPPHSKAYYSWSKKIERDLKDVTADDFKNQIKNEVESAYESWKIVLKELDCAEIIEEAINFKLCEFCNKRKATTYKEVLDTWTSPYLPIKKPACEICASKPPPWMT